MSRPFNHEAGGILHIERLAIDTGGHWTNDVYGWVSRQPPGRVMAVKGIANASVAVGAPSYVEVNQAGAKLRRGAKLWPLGVSLLKSQLYGWLQQDAPRDGEPAPEGYCHYPAYGEEFFQQLCAERLVRRTSKAGYAKLEWEKTRDRNEALDMRVYAIAAAMACQIDRWTEADWQEIERAVGVRRDDPAEAEIPEDAPPAMPTVVRSRWMNRP